MAVFLINICKFNGCGIKFDSLSELITHIENIHIDYDPLICEQKELAQPPCLPLSYVLRFITDAAREDGQLIDTIAKINNTNNLNAAATVNLNNNIHLNNANINKSNTAILSATNNTTSSIATINNNNNNNNITNINNSNIISSSPSNATDLKRKAIKHHSYSLSSSNRSSTPTGSEIDDEEMIVSESENSNDSWTTEEFSSEFIMKYGSRHSGAAGNNSSNEKPFACPVPGCKKRYKNVNGIKYHSKNGHKKEGKVRKGFKCYCGKSYKTSQGLKNHSMLVHNTASTEALNYNGKLCSPSGSTSSASSSNSSNSNSNSSNSNSNQSFSPKSTFDTLHHHHHHAGDADTHMAGSNGLAHAATGSADDTNGGGKPVAATAVAAATVPQTFSLIALKTIASANGLSGGHAMSSAHNPNKLVKVHSDCFDASQLLGGKAAAAKSLIIGSENNRNNNNILDSAITLITNKADSATVKTSLPNLVNLGILTPASSPKQHQSLLSSPSHVLTHSCTDESMLPLTPISPATVGKVLQFAGKPKAKDFLSHPNDTNNNKHNRSNSITDFTDIATIGKQRPATATATATVPSHGHSASVIAQAAHRRSSGHTSRQKSAIDTNDDNNNDKSGAAVANKVDTGAAAGKHEACRGSRRTSLFVEQSIQGVIGDSGLIGKT